MFKALNVAVYLGDNPDQYLTNKGHPLLYRVSNSKTSLQMLVKNKIDVMPESKVGMGELLLSQNIPLKNIKPVYEIEALNSDLSLAFNLNSSADLFMRYQAAFLKLEKDGVVQQLKTKWGLEHE